MTTFAEAIADLENLPDDSGVLHALDKTGDTRITWDRHNADEVANAKRTFDDLRAKGFAAFSVRKGGEKGEVLTSFDPAAEKIVMTPALRGG